MAFVRVELKKQKNFVKIDDFEKETCLNLAIKGKRKFKVVNFFYSEIVFCNFSCERI